MIHIDSVYKIGVIGKPHGIKGEISFLCSDDVFDRVNADYLILKVDGIFVPFFIEEYRFKNNETVLIKFESIDSLEQAREFVGCEVFFSRELAQQDSDNLSWAQIVGFSIIDFNTNEKVGDIVEVDDTTINLLFVVKTKFNTELLIPASHQLIKDIDENKQTITIDVPHGTLDL